MQLDKDAKKQIYVAFLTAMITTLATKSMELAVDEISKFIRPVKK